MQYRIIGILLAVLVVLGISEWVLHGQNLRDFRVQSQQAAVSDRYKDTLAMEPCSYFQCLFKASGQIIGYAQLDGYYRAETVTGGGEENVLKGATETCDRFVVTGGSKSLIDQFRLNIARGNTLSQLDNDTLVINLDLKDPNLDPALAGRIRASTSERPISLGVLQPSIDGKGATPCTSVIRILNENSVLD